MIDPPSLTETTLTGKYRFKKSFWNGSMVLWIQEQVIYYPNQFDEDLKSKHLIWRKAEEFDIPQMIKYIKGKKPFCRALTIEEFHIGYKYEEYQMDSNRYFNQGMIWVKKEYSLKSPRLFKIKRLIEQGIIRRPQ